MWRVWVCGMCLLAIVLRVGAPARAQDGRTDFLVRMLESSSQFRVRTQAALALGSRPAEATAVKALGAALRDEHPSVRAASAGALELLKDPSALAALRSARKDKDSSARSAIEHAIGTLERLAVAPTSKPTEPGAGSTFYVAIGTPSAQSGLPSTALRSLREHVVQQVAGLEGVRIAPENEGQAAAANIVRTKKMIGYYLDSSVTKIETRPDGALRAQVSVIVGTYPGRAMRVMLSGAATLSGGGSSDDAKLQAAEAAFTGALRRLPQALQAGTASAE
ncbi:MAG: lyase repeat-like domain protein [Myxococcaceae bacterium]|nr:lyase repeat-like domain protein [Myxococcaceae bacterium]